MGTPSTDDDGLYGAIQPAAYRDDADLVARIFEIMEQTYPPVVQHAVSPYCREAAEARALMDRLIGRQVRRGLEKT